MAEADLDGRLRVRASFCAAACRRTQHAARWATAGGRGDGRGPRQQRHSAMAGLQARHDKEMVAGALLGALAYKLRAGGQRPLDAASLSSSPMAMPVAGGRSWWIQCRMTYGLSSCPGRRG